MPGAGRPIEKCCKEIVLRVVAYFEAEKKEQKPFLPFDNAQLRACAALGISRSTIAKIVHEGKNGDLRAPKKTRNRHKTVTNIDKYQKAAIRRTIHYLCKENKCVTAETILLELKQRDLFQGSKSSLFRVMRELNFTWKFEKNKRYVAENIEASDSSEED